jgi:hypothetical protein
MGSGDSLAKRKDRLARGGYTRKRGTHQEEGDIPIRGTHWQGVETLARGGYIHKGRKTEKSKPKARRLHDETTRRYLKLTRQTFTTAQKGAEDTRHPA